MSKDDVLRALDASESSLRQLKTRLGKTKSEFASSEIKNLIEQICKKWFGEVEPSLSDFGALDDIRKKYRDLFAGLAQLSMKRCRKTSCIGALDKTIANFRNDLVLPVITSSGRIVYVTHLNKILENAGQDEADYLKEAIGCAYRGFFRASIVLGWNATMHRIHKVVEKFGFDEFNKKSMEMKGIKEGRFGKFGKAFVVHSLNELRSTVFDKDLLWVLEYWGLIDKNQHDRLSICLTMRVNSAHPGEAPITKENLASFYSDLKTIIFDNQKFRLLS